MTREIIGSTAGRRRPEGYEEVLVDRPEVVAMLVPESADQTREMALLAREGARRAMPKITGRTSQRLYPVWAEGLFGVRFVDSHVWFLERGIRPFTMTQLAGKTIPMWIDDPTGEEQAKNSKARTRTTEDGRRQVLIFRKVASPGATKEVWQRDRSGGTRRVSTSRRGPGAAGRIAVRDASGRIAKGNTGVRWRHSGTPPEGYLADALINVARQWGHVSRQVVATDKDLTGISDDIDVMTARAG